MMAGACNCRSTDPLGGILPVRAGFTAGLGLLVLVLARPRRSRAGYDQQMKALRSKVMSKSWLTDAGRGRRRIGVPRA